MRFYLQFFPLLLMLSGCALGNVDHTIEFSNLERSVINGNSQPIDLIVLDRREDKRIAHDDYGTATVTLSNTPMNIFHDGISQSLEDMNFVLSKKSDLYMEVVIKEFYVRIPPGSINIQVKAHSTLLISLKEKTSGRNHVSEEISSIIVGPRKAPGPALLGAGEVLNDCAVDVINQTFSNPVLIAYFRDSGIKNEQSENLFAADNTIKLNVTETLVSPEDFVSVNSQRIALVIGNSSYSAPLKNPVRDADDIALMLSELGFEVIKVTNANLRAMSEAVERFYNSLKKGGVGLFYYAGHGIQIDGQNYLVPIGVTINSESDVKYECLNAGRILGKMEDAGNGMNIIILDACRNNPFARSFRTAERGLARMDAPTGSILAYSTAPGSVASDGSGRNGVYTKHLLRYLREPGLDTNSLFIKVRKAVINETGGRQVPWESSSLTGLFYFLDN